MSDTAEIYTLIPQRPPFLFVDKIIEREEKRIKTCKMLTGDEDFFKGHFPGRPIMPGVLLQEALLQTGALLMSLSNKSPGLGVVTKVEKGRFREMVTPGRPIEMEVWHLETVGNAFYFKGTVTQDGKKALDLHFTCAKVG
ncbi:MAG: beta-hydroxyacyl-ACP dehydratase [Bdellovibrio sp.]|nr:beta-hydroxyacyl-ACP dehydratase [Bdellovibrio sp.]